ncbi:MAG: HAD-IA family hydrolase [Chloroflexi bacterium]|nr:HAD-IA family hydrolase [Chloroflexota bacterium]
MNPALRPSRESVPAVAGLTSILFDFGGTLADIVPTHEWLFIRPCREYGIELDPARVIEAQDLGWEPYLTPQGPAHPHASRDRVDFARFKSTLLAQRLRSMGVDGPVEAIAARVYELDTQPEMYRAFDDAVPTLVTLRERGYSLAILSNHEWDLPDLVAGLGLAPYFSAIVTSARVGYRKPHPRMYQQALAALGARPEQALMVGDSMASDVAGAERLGMRAVLLDRHGTLGGTPRVAVISRLTALLEFL